MDSTATRCRHEPGALYRATVTAECAERGLCLGSTQLPPAVHRGQQSGAVDGPERFNILALMDVALAAYGHADAIVAARLRRSASEEANRLQLLREVETAFAGSGAWWQSETPPMESALIAIRTVAGTFTWYPAGFQWIRQPIMDRCPSEEKRMEWRREGARVHTAMLALGWPCTDHCGWGDCDPHDAVETMKQLVRAQGGYGHSIHCSDTEGCQWIGHHVDDNYADDHLYWRGSDGWQWVAHRINSDVSDGED